MISQNKPQSYKLRQTNNIRIFFICHEKSFEILTKSPFYKSFKKYEWCSGFISGGGCHCCHCCHCCHGPTRPKCRPFCSTNFRTFLASSGHIGRPLLLQDRAGDERGELQASRRVAPIGGQEGVDEPLLRLPLEPLRGCPSALRPRLPLSRLCNANKFNKYLGSNSVQRKMSGLQIVYRKSPQHLPVINELPWNKRWILPESCWSASLKKDYSLEINT